MTTNDSSRYVLLSFDERQLLASAARGVSQALGVVPGSALMWGPFADAARTLEKQAEHGTPVNKEAVERACKAFYEDPVGGIDDSIRPAWTRLASASPDVADRYRQMMSAALEAAFSGGSA